MMNPAAIDLMDCPECQGRGDEDCSLCHGDGVVNAGVCRCPALAATEAYVRALATLSEYIPAEALGGGGDE